MSVITIAVNLTITGKTMNSAAAPIPAAWLNSFSMFPERFWKGVILTQTILTNAGFGLQALSMHFSG
jgi:hypothetical protein